MHPAYDLAAHRARIPLLATAIPMNNCSQAPQTDVTRAAAERYLESWNTRGMDWEGWVEEVQRAKAAFAALINASPEEIAVFSSVTDAANAVASAVHFIGSRNGVVVSEAEFPTIGHVWLAQESTGARVAWARVHDGVVDASQYDDLIDERTTVVSACHAYYVNGAMQDVALLAKRAHADGALLFVDAYQTAGAVPIDVKVMDVDFLASGCLKYLMGVAGIAFLYVRRELIASLHPTVTGWFGRANPFAFDAKTLDWSSTAARLEHGTPPIVNAYIARAGIELVSSVGVRAIRGWHGILSQRLIDGAHARGLTLHGSAARGVKTANTAVVVPESHVTESRMRERGVIPSARGAVIRLAPHYYTSLDDIDRTLDVLAETLRG